MKCENYFCIYENDGFCRLESVELDILGQCKECIYINIEKEKLKKIKEQSRIIAETKTARGK